ncbi:MAG: site-2 protease family protein [Opitutaceae bacterium]
MFGWSINLFRIRGIQLAVHSSFLLLLAYAAYEGWRDGGWMGALLSAGLLLAFFACVVLHELGHSFTAMAYGIGVRRILLMPIGGMAEMDAIPRQPTRELLITLAGPAVNFLIVAILWPIVGFPSAGYSENLFVFFGQMLLKANLWMGLFNLLPAFPMDGGRILRALLAQRVPYLRATYLAVLIGKVICVGGIIVGLVLWQQYPLLPFVFGFILFAGNAEYRAVQRRETEEAHWRTVSGQFLSPRAQPEPPVLGP